MKLGTHPKLRITNWGASLIPANIQPLSLAFHHAHAFSLLAIIRGTPGHRLIVVDSDESVVAGSNIHHSIIAGSVRLCDSFEAARIRQQNDCRIDRGASFD